MKTVKTKITASEMISPIYMTFFAGFLALSGSTLITLLGSFTERAKNNTYLRGALISETCVNVIAGFTYMYFIKYLYEKSIELKDITSVRYLDWMLTTPLLLFSYALFAHYSNDKEGTGDKIDLIPLIYIIILNLGMLIFGFLGEIKKIGKWTGLISGFICYGVMMYFLYEKYTKDKNGDVLFIIFATVWALYGVSYLLNVKYKNIAYNFLDIISKAGFGILIYVTLLLEGPGTT